MPNAPKAQLQPKPATFTIGSLLVSIDPASRVSVTSLRDLRISPQVAAAAQQRPASSAWSRY